MNDQLPPGVDFEEFPLAGAEEVLLGLAQVFFSGGCANSSGPVGLPLPSSQSANRQQFDEQARYQSLIEQLPAVIFMASLEGGRGQTYVSPQIENMLGYSPSEWLEDPLRWYASIHDEDKGRWSVEAARMFLTGEPLKSVYRVIAKNGRVVWFRCEAKMTRDKNGRLSFIQGIGFDVTEMMEMQAELRSAKEAADAASRAKSEFLVNVSHEIRTPMNGILGMTALTLETELNAEQRECLEAVRFSADALMVIVNEILDFSKIEAKQLRLEVADFDIRDNVEGVLKTLSAGARQKGLNTFYRVQTEVPEVIAGDSGRLRQVLLNLVGNAIKFTERGRIGISVALESEREGELVLHFQVTDTGIGIPATARESIFKPFTQADSSNTRKYGGTGLGLTICAQLVELMHGKIWVESNVGSGSTFHFTASCGKAQSELSDTELIELAIH